MSKVTPYQNTYCHCPEDSDIIFKWEVNRLEMVPTTYTAQLSINERVVFTVFLDKHQIMPFLLTVARGCDAAIEKIDAPESEGDL